MGVFYLRAWVVNPGWIQVQRSQPRCMYFGSPPDVLNASQLLGRRCGRTTEVARQPPL